MAEPPWTLRMTADVDDTLEQLSRVPAAGYTVGETLTYNGEKQIRLILEALWLTAMDHGMERAQTHIAQAFGSVRGTS